MGNAVDHWWLFNARGGGDVDRDRCVGLVGTVTGVILEGLMIGMALVLGGDVLGDEWGDIRCWIRCRCSEAWGLLNCYHGEPGQTLAYHSTTYLVRASDRTKFIIIIKVSSKFMLGLELIESAHWQEVSISCSLSSVQKESGRAYWSLANYYWYHIVSWYPSYIYRVDAKWSKDRENGKKSKEKEHPVFNNQVMRSEKKIQELHLAIGRYNCSEKRYTVSFVHVKSKDG